MGAEVFDAGSRGPTRVDLRRTELLAHFHTGGVVSNGPTEAVNLLERNRRASHGFRNFSNYRSRCYWHTDTRLAITAHHGSEDPNPGLWRRAALPLIGLFVARTAVHPAGDRPRGVDHHGSRVLEESDCGHSRRSLRSGIGP